MILPFLLHHANRSKSQHFYKIKDKLLKLYAKEDGYDIQYIPGKQCFSCGSSGIHHYDQYGCPEHCWNCIRGWFKLPQWICLQRYKYGKYVFHTPLKREYQLLNPWIKEEMGWEVSNRPVIEGYVEHDTSRYTNFALAVLFMRYDTKRYLRYELGGKLRWKLEMMWIDIKNIKFNFREEEGLPF